MSLVVRFPDSLRPERTYAASVVFDAHLGLPHEVVFENRRDILMHAAGDLKRTVQLPDLVFAAGDQDWPARAVRPATILMDAIAELGDRKANDATFGEATQTALFDADVFGTVFWYLTRLEEVQSPDRDQHGRFPASDSRDENQRPYVDELVDALGRVLVSVWPTLQLRRHKFEAR